MSIRKPFWVSGRILDVALILAAAILLAPILYVGWRPVLAPHAGTAHGLVELRAAAGEARP